MIHVILGVLFLAHLADGLTTYRALAIGGKEINPILRASIAAFGPAWGLLLPKAASFVVMAAVVALHPGSLLFAAVLLFCVLLFVVSASNVLTVGEP